MGIPRHTRGRVLHLSHQIKPTCPGFVSAAAINYPGQKKKGGGVGSLLTWPLHGLSVGKAKATGLQPITATVGSRGNEHMHACARLAFSSFIQPRAQAWRVGPPSLG